MTTANANTDLVPAETTIAAVPVEEGSGLSAAQVVAMGALLSGKTATDAAIAAGVSRRTMHLWLRKNFAFQAALNSGRREFRQAVACRIGQITADAAECVAGAVRNGDVKTSLEVLKRTGSLTATEIGSDDQQILQMEDQERTEMRDLALALAGPGDPLSQLQLLVERIASKGK